jgi:hypothetical protein
LKIGHRKSIDIDLFTTSDFNSQDISGYLASTSLKDIGAMKLNAIFGNGSRLKDFVDIHDLLEIYSLEELIAASEKKYPENSISMIKHALLHQDDIDFTVRIDYTGQDVNGPPLQAASRRLLTIRT